MADCLNLVPNFEQDRLSILKALQKNQLLTMEIEFSLRCNFSCPYCYVPRIESLNDELSTEEIFDVILQAKALGVKRVVVLGGEPTIYPTFREKIQFIRQHGMQVELFTNGSGVDHGLAKFLYANSVRVVLKMNSFKPDLQDTLAGKKGAHQYIKTAFEALKAAGYPSQEAFFAVSTVICNPNLEELPVLWRWLRDQNIVPYFEMITPQENALNNRWLFVEPEKVHELFKILADIDRKDYGMEWEPQPPLVGNRCLRHLFSCLVTARGGVMPCVGLNLSLGNVRSRTLKDILHTSRVVKDLKNYRETIKGPCRTCDQAENCYGCRGAAYQMTGDYLASDPLCWKNCGNIT